MAWNQNACYECYWSTSFVRHQKQQMVRQFLTIAVFGE